MSYSSEPLKKYSEDLAARLPAPGGGSASALVGNLAAALNCMVCNFTLGNEKYKSVESDILQTLSEMEALRVELLSLVQADVDAYSEYSKASKELKVSGLSPEEKAVKQEELVRKAAETPLLIMKAAAKVLKACMPLCEKGNKYLLSDVEVAAVFALAAVKGANVNVRINLAYMKDEVFKAGLKKEANGILIESERMEKEVAGFCGGKY